MASAEVLNVWGTALRADALTDTEIHYLSSLPQQLPPVQWVWAELDRVWRELRLDNRRPLSGQPVGAFYAHPVWLMNGLFSAADPESQGHRAAIAKWVAERSPRRVADYGGGFGELARLISAATPDASVAIVEPFPSKAAQTRFHDHPEISFVAKLDARAYDVVIAQDVLEHVERPIGLAVQLARAVRVGGSIVFANNFFPVIACHIPRTFHLRRSFRYVMQMLGLHYAGAVPGAPHAQIFVVQERLHPWAAHAASIASSCLWGLRGISPNGRTETEAPPP
jgi:2-polyprenyl-3-methyl-5-hydroxy-6-metoxy-1,4-benzoquinol methylase